MKKLKKMLCYLLIWTMFLSTMTSTGTVVQASEEGIQGRSLLPLEEVNAYLVLNDYSEEEIKAMPIDTVLSLLQDREGNYIEVSSEAKVVWAHFKDDEGNIIRDEYHTIGREETVDLTEFEYTTGYSMELIVGSGNQLDLGNVRYIVRVYITNKISEQLDYELYLQEQDGSRVKIIPQNIFLNYTSVVGLGVNTVVYLIPEHIEGMEYYLGVSSLADEHPNIVVDVYTLDEFRNYLISGIGNAITSQILNQNMEKLEAGYRGVFDPPSNVYDGKNMFFIVYTDKSTGSMLSYEGISFCVSNDMAYLTSEMLSYENGELIDNTVFYVNSMDVDYLDIDLGTGNVTGNGVICEYFMLKDGYSVNEEYYFVLDAHSSIWKDDANSHVVKAVIGHYNSLADTEGLEDIKEQLIPVDRTSVPYGYKANYNYKNNGVDFTVFFDDNTVYKFNVRIMEYTPKYDPANMPNFDDAPIVGSKDPWFRVDGIKQNNSVLDTYIVENGKNINMDTMYGYGYQTILINDKDVDLTQLKPTFWYGDADRVETYIGSKQESGVSVQDFSNGMVQYSTIIDKNVKNYQVNLVKKETGAKLFVNGPSTRTVFLDEYFEYKHDILIANVGDEPLTGLKVTLDAKNVKLDDYWTIGGKNNSTLAAFTTTEDYSQYGELANLAKIRLLPDGEGEVKGTLTISADGQDDVVIQLTGRATNPTIVTKELDDGVKYVPYSYVVATDNMNDWNTVTFSIESGELPEGLELYPTTGEIYGVPQESGEFTIRIKATYGRSDYFEPSYADFTLVVKENTNENVYNASDEGYGIKQSIGTEINQYEFVLETIEDTVFTSYGEYGEFIDLWLNGQKLIEDEDYTKEDGSTKITIKSQTFENKANKESANTIAMEFRNEDNELNRTAQNFVTKTESKVDKVISQIAKLPSNITLNDKSAVQAARTAYNALSSSDAKKVINYSKLTQAEAKIVALEAEQRENEKNKESANKVITLIEKLPSVITLDSKVDVKNARDAYNALTSKQKNLVTNLKRLQKAEAAITQLEEEQAKIEADKAEANKVVTLIDALPKNITLNNKDAINHARTAYNNLTASQKGYIVNYKKLTDAENMIVALELEEKEKAKINEVITLIQAIPKTLTLKDKNTVETARFAYNALTDEQKKAVINYNDLLNAEEMIIALEAQEKAEKADKEAADEVIAFIDTIPTELTLSYKDMVESVRSVYENLTEAQKQLVSNYNVLTKAEEKIRVLEEYENAVQKDQKAADKVISLINSIPDTITLENKELIEQIRASYDKLSESQK